MKHGFPESHTELCEFRLKRINLAQRALERCYEFNDSWVATQIDTALECLKIAKLQVEQNNEKTLRHLEKIDKDEA